MEDGCECARGAGRAGGWEDGLSLVCFPYLVLEDSRRSCPWFSTSPIRTYTTLLFTSPSNTSRRGGGPIPLVVYHHQSTTRCSGRLPSSFLIFTPPSNDPQSPHHPPVLRRHVQREVPPVSNLWMLSGNSPMRFSLRPSLARRSPLPNVVSLWRRYWSVVTSTISTSNGLAESK